MKLKFRKKHTEIGQEEAQQKINWRIKKSFECMYYEEEENLQEWDSIFAREEIKHYSFITSFFASSIHLWLNFLF